MDNVNKEIVEFFKTVGFSLIEIKSSVFRIEESTLVFQTDHKDHTIDASTILYKDAEKILTQALQAQRDAGAGEERKKIGAMIEEANYARKVGEKTGDPIAVWEVQDVIRQILALTQPTK